MYVYPFSFSLIFKRSISVNHDETNTVRLALEQKIDKAFGKRVVTTHSLTTHPLIDELKRHAEHITKSKNHFPGGCFCYLLFSVREGSAEVVVGPRPLSQPCQCPEEIPYWDW